MTGSSGIRPGELRIETQTPNDAALFFIGRAHTPWKDRALCPRQGSFDGPICRLEVFSPWDAALEGIEAYETIEVLYWLDQSRRDLVTQSPKWDGNTVGTFALRSPVRPNPIGLSSLRLLGREGRSLLVRGLDCLDGTPLIDLKPDRCTYSPVALPKNGVAE